MKHNVGVDYDEKTKKNRGVRKINIKSIFQC